MRVYVASAFKNERVQPVMKALRDAGHVITCDWVGKPGNLQNAKADMTGVLTADVFVFIADINGRNSLVELGMALASGLPVYVLGDVLDPEPKAAPTSGIIFLAFPEILREADYERDLLGNEIAPEHERDHSEDTPA